MEKKEIRKKVLDRRDRIPEEQRREKSIRIAKRLCGMPCFAGASSILIYRHFRSEAETTLLMEQAWKTGKRVYCPRVEGKTMEFFLVRTWEDFEQGCFGIEEPKSECPAFEEDPQEQALVILPGAAFDRNRNRIGYGGGFYDRYLANHPGLETAAVCFEEQIVEQIPAGPYDIRPRIIVTDQHCYE